MIRKSTLFIAFCLLFVANLTIGQVTSAGLAPSNALQDVQVNIEMPKNPASHGWTASGSATPWQLYSQTMGSTATATIGTNTLSVGFPGALAWVPSTQTLYLVDQITPFGIYTVDTTTGAISLVTNCTGLITTNSITGMTWDGTNMWGVSTDLASSQIFTINLSTGACTLIGSPTTVCAGPIMINAAPGGSLFSVDIVNDNLYKWNKTTGVPTLVGSLGVSTNFGQDGHFDLSDGTYYWAAYTSGPELRIIDTLTGGSTVVGTYSFLQASVLGIFYFDPTVGVTKNNLQSEITVYPNPNDGEFSVKTDIVADEIIILNALGEEIHQFIPESNLVNVSLSDLAKGMYFIRVKINDQYNYVRFVVSR